MLDWLSMQAPFSDFFLREVGRSRNRVQPFQEPLQLWKNQLSFRTCSEGVADSPNGEPYPVPHLVCEVKLFPNMLDIGKCGMLFHEDLCYIMGYEGRF